MNEKSLIRKHIAPATPLDIEVEGAEGKFVLHFRLLFNFNAFGLIEEKTGLNILQGQLFKDLNARNLTVMLWASMQAYQPEYAGEEGLEAVGTYLSLDNSMAVALALKKAFLNSLSKDKRESIEAAEQVEGKPADPQPAAPAQS